MAVMDMWQVVQEAKVPVTPQLATRCLISKLSSYLTKEFTKEEEANWLTDIDELIAAGADLEDSRLSIHPIIAYYLSSDALKSLIAKGLHCQKVVIEELTTLLSLNELLPEDHFEKILFLLQNAESGIEAKIIENCVTCKYKKALELLSKHHVLESLAPEVTKSLWKKALICNDTAYLSDLKEHYRLPWPLECELIESASLSGSPRLLRWVAAQYPPLTEEETNELCDKALALNLGNMAYEALSIYYRQDKALALLVDKLLKESDNAQALITRLDTLFLSTDLDLLTELEKELCQRYLVYSSILLKARADRLRWGSMISRYASPHFNGFLKMNYGNKEVDYLEQQRSFGLSAYRQTEEIVNELKGNQQKSVRDIYKKWMAWRSALALVRKNAEFAEQCTLFRDETSPPTPTETPLGRQYGLTPYSLALPYMEEVYAQARLERLQGAETLPPREQGYRLLYYPNGMKDPLPLTKVVLDLKAKKWIWKHVTDFRAWDCLEEIHKKILQQRCHKENPESLAILHAMIAEGYWLAANLAITSRSNAQYSKMLMASWYLYHDLPAPIVRLEIPDMDTLALTLPLERFSALNFFLEAFQQYE